MVFGIKNYYPPGVDSLVIKMMPYTYSAFYTPPQGSDLLCCVWSLAHSLWDKENKLWEPFHNEGIEALSSLTLKATKIFTK